MFQSSEIVGNKSYLNENFLNAELNPENNYEIVLNNIPKSINLDELWNIIEKIEFLSTLKQKKRLYHDCLLFIANLVNRQVVQIRKCSNLANNVLRKFLDKDRISLIHRILIELDIIVKGKYYQKGIESILYECTAVGIERKGRKYCIKPFDTQVVTFNDKTAFRRVVKTCIFFEEYVNENMEKIEENIKLLDIDVEKGYELYNKFRNNENFDREALKKFELFIDIVKDEKKSFWKKRDSKTGRIYTQYGGLNKVFRSITKLDGENIVEIDIKTCQPVLMTLYYPKKCKDRRIEAEKEKWINLVTKEDFYDYFNDRLKEKITDRGKLKEEIFIKIMFGGSKHYQSELWKIFEREFPYMAMMLISKKYNITPREVAMQLQRFESRIVIGTVFNELRITNPELIIIPNHDAFMVKESQSEIILEKFNKIFQDITGLNPKLVIKKEF
jgi:hypothetical protein